uniref:Uncharacterized protein n=1 Tax=Nelumbo nucifera TaxID=4432 RepID=A0A822YGG5_NELNU|nr:TPA_asm: hypothetical protein HUJ06_012135 [Nelumbo nucifera]
MEALRRLKSLWKIGGTGNGDDFAEDAAALALTDESQGTFEILGDFGDDTMDRTFIKRRVGVGESDGRARHLVETVDLLTYFRAVELEEHIKFTFLGSTPSLNQRMKPHYVGMISSSL